MSTISETVEDRDLVTTSKGPPIGNGLWGIKRSRDVIKRSSRDPNFSKAVEMLFSKNR